MKTERTSIKYDRNNNLQYRDLSEAPVLTDATPINKVLRKIHVDREYDLESPADMVRYVARNLYAWPGGYELILYTAGCAVCSSCVLERFGIELMDAKDGTWSDYAIGTSAEIDPESCYCENCNKDLSAYTEEPEA